MLCHINQPLGSCFGHFQEVVDLADELKRHKKRKRQHQQDTQSAEECIGPLNESEPERAMDIDDAFMEHEDLLVWNGAGHHGHVIQEYDGAAKGYGAGMTFMQQFESDQFSEERKQNLYYPFASRSEWELAAFLLRSGLSMAAVDTFLSLTLVRIVL